MWQYLNVPGCHRNAHQYVAAVMIGSKFWRPSITAALRSVLQSVTPTHLTELLVRFLEVIDDVDCLDAHRFERRVINRSVNRLTCISRIVELCSRRYYTVYLAQLTI